MNGEKTDSQPVERPARDNAPGWAARILLVPPAPVWITRLALATLRAYAPR